MVDARRGQRLAHETLANLLGQLVAALVRHDGLQRDDPPQLGVDGTVDGAHAALADVLADLVAIDPLPLDEEILRVRRHGPPLRVSRTSASSRAAFASPGSRRTASANSRSASSKRRSLIITLPIRT